MQQLWVVLGGSGAHHPAWHLLQVRISAVGLLIKTEQNAAHWASLSC
jgi:hypothetical protein